MTKKNKAFLPFLSNNAEPIKIYTKLLNEFPNMDIGRMYYIILTEGVSTIKDFVASNTPDSARPIEIKHAIESKFRVDIDYELQHRFLGVISKTESKQFKLSELKTEYHGDFLFYTYLTNRHGPYVAATFDLDKLSNRGQILADIGNYLKLADNPTDADETHTVLVKSKPEMENYLLMFVMSDTKAPIFFKKI